MCRKYGIRSNWVKMLAKFNVFVVRLRFYIQILQIVSRFF